MSIHRFTLTVSGLTCDQIDRLYVARCDDALLSECNGIVTLDFAREAPDMLTAIASAIDDVVSAGALVATPRAHTRERAARSASARF